MKRVALSEITDHPAYKLAMEIIDKSWLDEGYTREELAESSRIADLADEWLATGNDIKDFDPPARADLSLAAAAK